MALKKLESTVPDYVSKPLKPTEFILASTSSLFPGKQKSPRDFQVAEEQR